jgi:hypothetical protein
MQVTYTPKLQYQCENTLQPAPDSLPENEPTFTLDGTGGCKTSPYDFKSLVAGPNTEQALVDKSCKLLVFANEGCSGDPTTISLTDGADECHFVGGRSASLTCIVDDGSAPALSQLSSLCSTNSTTAPTFSSWASYANATLTTATASQYGNSGPTGAPVVTSVPATTTSSSGSKASPTVTATSSISPPFTGAASVQGGRWSVVGWATVIGMVASMFRR